MEVNLATVTHFVTATTTATNTAVINIDTRGTSQGKAYIMIKNLSGSNTMYYQITGYPADKTGTNGQSVAFKSQTSIATSGTATSSTDVTIPCALLQVLVQNNSGACACQIDVIAY